MTKKAPTKIKAIGEPKYALSSLRAKTHIRLIVRRLLWLPIR